MRRSNNQLSMAPWAHAQGAIAQLGERVLCKHEVVGSIPSGSTSASGSTRSGLAGSVWLGRRERCPVKEFAGAFARSVILHIVKREHIR